MIDFLCWTRAGFVVWAVLLVVWGIASLVNRWARRGLKKQRNINDDLLLLKKHLLEKQRSEEYKRFEQAATLWGYWVEANKVMPPGITLAPPPGLNINIEYEGPVEPEPAPKILARTMAEGLN